MYNHYAETAKKVIPNLSSEEIEAIYRYKEMEYRMEDVKAHAEDMYNEEELTYSEKVYVCDAAELLAERYLYKYHDCSLAENDVFREMIRNYILDEKDNIPIIEEEE
jgi:hypothetical protein